MATAGADDSHEAFFQTTTAKVALGLFVHECGQRRAPLAPLREARAESLREELGELQNYWSRKARERGILTEEDLQRYLES